MAQFVSDNDTSDNEDNRQENFDNNDSEEPLRIPIDNDFPGSKFLESLCIFRMMHENGHHDGERLSGKQRKNYIDKLKESYKTLGSSLEFKDYIIRSTRVRWTSFEKDMKYWELYDKKEDYLKRITRKQDDDDKDDRNIRRKVRRRSRSRSRSRSRDRNHNYKRRNERRSRDKDERENLGDMEHKKKERVK